MRTKSSKMIPKKIRDAVRERDRVCIHCGGRGTDIHHRQRRRDGGHTMANCILLCHDDHMRMHAEPGLARRFGLIVSAHIPIEEVHLIPVRAPRGWLLVPQEGTPTYTQVPSGDAETHYFGLPNRSAPREETP